MTPLNPNSFFSLESISADTTLLMVKRAKLDSLMAKTLSLPGTITFSIWPLCADSDAVAEQKKRARVEGEDGAAVQTTEPSNDAVEAKKAKLDTSVPLEEEAKTVESEDVAAKDGE